MSFGAFFEFFSQSPKLRTSQQRKQREGFVEAPPRWRLSLLTRPARRAGPTTGEPQLLRPTARGSRWRVVKLVSQFANCGAGPSPHPGPEVHSLQTVNIVMRTTRASRYHGGCGRTACVARAAMERRLPAGGEARPTIWRLGGTPRPTVYTSGRATRRGKAVLPVGVRPSDP